MWGFQIKYCQCLIWLLLLFVVVVVVIDGIARAKVKVWLHHN